MYLADCSTFNGCDWYRAVIMLSLWIHVSLTSRIFSCNHKMYNSVCLIMAHSSKRLNSKHVLLMNFGDNIARFTRALMVLEQVTYRLLDFQWHLYIRQLGWWLLYNHNSTRVNHHLYSLFIQFKTDVCWYGDQIVLLHRIKAYSP